MFKAQYRAVMQGFQHDDGSNSIKSRGPLSHGNDIQT